MSLTWNLGVKTGGELGKGGLQQIQTEMMAIDGLFKGLALWKYRRKSYSIVNYH